MALAAEDIGDQHRRTTLGPLWLLLNYLAFAGTFIYIFKRGEGIANYEAYVAVGLFVWMYVMETLVPSVSLFVREEGFIKGTTLPLSVYVMRLFMQSIIRAGYALIGCLAILFLTGISVSWFWIWSIVGIVLILLIAPAAIILLALLGTFFPDSQFLVSNVMRIGMFLTPVFWAYEGGNSIRAAFYYWNPFTYLLEMVRTPILYEALPIQAISVSVVIGLSLWFLALLLLGRSRKQIAFLL